MERNTGRRMFFTVKKRVLELSCHAQERLLERWDCRNEQEIRAKVQPALENGVMSPRICRGKNLRTGIKIYEHILAHEGLTLHIKENVITTVFFDLSHYAKCG